MPLSDGGDGAETSTLDAPVARRQSRRQHAALRRLAAHRELAWRVNRLVAGGDKQGCLLEGELIGVRQLGEGDGQFFGLSVRHLHDCQETVASSNLLGREHHARAIGFGTLRIGWLHLEAKDVVQLVAVAHVHLHFRGHQHIHEHLPLPAIVLAMENQPLG